MNMNNGIQSIAIDAGSTVIINGAVVKVSGDRCLLEVDAGTSVVTENDILTQEEATTPAKRIYVMLLLMHIDPQAYRTHYIPFMDYMIDFMKGSHIQEVRKNLMLILKCVESGRYFNALEACRGLMQFESKLFSDYAVTQ